MNIAYTCKICKRPGIAKFDDDAPQSWLGRLQPLLSCDPCYDLRTEFWEATNAILHHCQMLARMAMVRMKPSEQEATRSRIRPELELLTRKYARVMAKYRNLAGPVWEEDFVDQLVENPGSCGLILRAYRMQLKQMFPKQMPANLPHAD